MVRRVVDHLIRERGHHRITIDPAAANAAAIRAYGKVGFKPVGIMRDYERDADGDGWHDGAADGAAGARPRLAAERADELARVPAQVPDQLAHLGEPGAQLGVADLDREHRVLQVGERGVALVDRGDRGLEEALDALRRMAGLRRRPRPGREPVALGEPGVGPLRAPVGDLDGPEQLRLEPVAGLLVELLVRRAERRERDCELVDRVGDGVEQVLLAPPR